MDPGQDITMQNLSLPAPSPLGASSDRDRKSAVSERLVRSNEPNKITRALEELYRYRELAFFLAWRDVKVRYKQAVLGILWAVIQPVLTMVVFTLLFGKLAGLGSDGLPPSIFYLSGLVPWLYFSSTITNASMSLVGNADMLTKIYFPRMLLPIAVAGGNLIDLAIGTGILLVMALILGVAPALSWLLWPLLVVPLAILSVSIGMVLAALNVKYRDIRYVVPFTIQLWLFATPIVYPVSLVPEHYRPLLALNPLTGFIEVFRHSLDPATPLHWELLLSSISMTIVLFAAAVAFFTRSERAFADHV
jgi:lipopolysaccharide transport system permease protein